MSNSKSTAMNKKRGFTRFKSYTNEHDPGYMRGPEERITHLYSRSHTNRVNVDKSNAKLHGQRFVRLLSVKGVDRDAGGRIDEHTYARTRSHRSKSQLLKQLKRHESEYL